MRRKLERERALGTGELLAAGVAKAKRSPAPVREAPPARSAAPVIELPEAPPGEDTFALTPPPPVEKPVAKRGAGKTTADAPDPAFDLPAFTDDLYPSALDGGRDQLVVLSGPVLDKVAAEARACTKCGLCSTRTNAVPGVGSARTGIVFVGEAPGADEDARGEPFVGRAGELLTKMIAAMDEKKLIPGVKLSRETVYIANVLKCRPPGNRDPRPD